MPKYANRQVAESLGTEFTPLDPQETEWVKRIPDRVTYQVEEPLMAADLGSGTVRITSMDIPTVMVSHVESSRLDTPVRCG